MTYTDEDRYDCAICGAESVRFTDHYHIPKFSKMWLNTRRSEAEMRFVGWEPREARRDLFVVTGVLVDD